MIFSSVRSFFQFGLIVCGLFTIAVANTFSNANDQDSIRVAPVRIKPADCRVGELFPPIKFKAVDGREFELGNAGDKTAPKHTAPKHTAPKHTAPKHTAPKHTAPKYKATVIALTSTSCPICKKYVSTLAAIEKRFSKEGIRFCFLNTLPSDELVDIQATIKDHQLNGPYVHDKEDRFTKALSIRTTAEVFVFDSARTLVYRGAVDDQYGLGYSLPNPRQNYLIQALESLVADKEIVVSATTAPGCDLWQPDSKSSNAKSGESSSITYHNRISRIIHDNCVSCHREDGLAPFSLETADDVISHAGMIKTVIKNGTMPPWFASEPVDDQGTKNNQGNKNSATQEAPAQRKLKWANDRSLTAGQKYDLVNWIDSKRVLGNPADAPKPRKFTEGWNIGAPDRVFQIPAAVSIKATGTMPYKHTIVKTDFAEDKWISAVEIRPTDRTVVHHVLVYIRKGRRGGGIDETSGFLAAYVPGNSFQIFPPGFAKKIPAGSSLFFQLHYTPVGKKTTDRTEIGFKFYKGTPKHLIRNRGISNRRIRIKPNASNHRETASLPIPTDVKILGFMPHMHLRGKAFRYDFVDPEKRKMTVLDIPRYDFNWQLEYRLAEPISLAKGSKIEVTGWYDNSDKNPANPNPNREVRWGDQTYDEMMLGYVEYYVPSEVIDGAADSNPKPDSKVNSAAEKPDRRTGRFAKSAAILAFRRYDKNKDGKVTREELGRPTIFDSLNVNGDDVLTLQEVLSFARKED